MTSSILWSILGGLLNVSIVLLVAHSRGTAAKSECADPIRQGRPMQPYFDLLKLLGKEDIESGETP